MSGAAGSSLNLRDLVAAAVRDALGEMVTASVQDALRADQSRTPDGHTTALRTLPQPDARTAAVRIASDADLDAFARHLLALFENPKNRQDLRSGRLRFRLAATASVAAPGPTSKARRVDQGAVTERHVKAAAESGERIVLGPRAVLTPLGREKARALGVQIEKER